MHAGCSLSAQMGHALPPAPSTGQDSHLDAIRISAPPRKAAGEAPDGAETENDVAEADRIFVRRRQPPPEAEGSSCGCTQDPAKGELPGFFRMSFARCLAGPWATPLCLGRVAGLQVRLSFAILLGSAISTQTFYWIFSGVSTSSADPRQHGNASNFLLPRLYAWIPVLPCESFAASLPYEQAYKSVQCPWPRVDASSSMPMKRFCAWSSLTNQSLAQRDSSWQGQGCSFTKSTAA